MEKINKFEIPNKTGIKPTVQFNNKTINLPYKDITFEFKNKPMINRSLFKMQNLNSIQKKFLKPTINTINNKENTINNYKSLHSKTKIFKNVVTYSKFNDEFSLIKSPQK